MEDIYNLKKRIESQNRALEESSISRRNKEIIRRFVKYLEINSYSNQRISKYINKLNIIAEILKVDFDKVKKENIENLILKIRERKFCNRLLSQETIIDYNIIIKRFYKWLLGNEETFPKEVSWLKTTVPKSKKKLPENLLNDENVEKLIKNAKTLRDKCIISVLYDSGMRIGELLTCKIKHVSFFNDYAEIQNPEGKTGSRRILLIPSVPYLLNWIQNHPLGKEDDCLFISLCNKSQFERMTPKNVNRMLKELAKKCNINKRISCHQFRHASATKSARFLTDAQMKERFGWVQDSKMASVYIHMSGRDSYDAVKRMYGIKEQVEVKENMKPVKCHICDTINGFEHKYCRKCGRALSLEVVMEKEEKDKDLIEFIKSIEGLKKINPELFNMLKELGKQKGIIA